MNLKSPFGGFFDGGNVMAIPKLLITGGSRGIGEAMVRRFARQNRVSFTYCQSAEKARTISDETHATAYPCDVRDEKQILSLAKTLGRVDTLILNAGISKTGLFQDMKTADLDDLFAVNLRGVLLTARAFLPAMLSAHTGCIPLISSIWGAVGASCETAYSASKAALIGLTKALAKEVAPSGIRVNCLCPGVIDTDMLNEYDETDRRDLIDRTPLGRLGAPDDIAAAAEFLCGESASFITGQTLTVDGGFAL